jgi:CRAL/TRIO domain
MLVLNAPGFFALSWGLIKKFIDPRTAARIQLFSSAEKGQVALEKLVDASQIPSDYGGDNISLKDAFLREAADPSMLRQEIELLHCKKKGKAHTQSWVLNKNETMEISIYTRSVSKANVFIKLNDSTFKTVQAECLYPDGNPESPFKPLPNRIRAVSKNLVGPGRVTVEVIDLDTAEKKHSGMSRGYFLAVGDVKSVKPKTIPSPVSDPGSPPKKAKKLLGSTSAGINKRRTKS